MRKEYKKLFVGGGWRWRRIKEGIYPSRRLVRLLRREGIPYGTQFIRLFVDEKGGCEIWELFETPRGMKWDHNYVVVSYVGGVAVINTIKDLGYKPTDRTKSKKFGGN